MLSLLLKPFSFSVSETDYWEVLKESGWGGAAEMDLCELDDLIGIGVKAGHAKLITVRWKKYRGGEPASFTAKHRGTELLPR